MDDREPANTGVLWAGWEAPANVRALTTLRTGPGVSSPPFDRFNMGLRSGDELGHVEENRARLVAELVLPSLPQWLQQVHGTAVARVSASVDDEPMADAAYTDTPRTVLSILTADCLPVLFCDVQGTEVAAAHAGWRGLAGGVLEATVAAMRSRREDVLAWLGPAAGQRAYEVGEEVRDAFVAQSAAAQSAFVATRPGHWLVDLYALARLRLGAEGVSRIEGGGLCTISDPRRFYSHRRDQRTGRMASLIWLA